MPRVRGAGGSLDLAGVRCLHAAVTRSFIPLWARDVAQVGAGHLDHPADAAVEYHLAPSEGKASNLFGGDPWRDRKSVWIGDELDQFRLGARECFLQGLAHVAWVGDAPGRESRAAGYGAEVHGAVVCLVVGEAVHEYLQLDHAKG